MPVRQGDVRWVRRNWCGLTHDMSARRTLLDVGWLMAPSGRLMMSMILCCLESRNSRILRQYSFVIWWSSSVRSVKDIALITLENLTASR